MPLLRILMLLKIPRGVVMANKILKPSRYNYAGHLTNGTVLAVNFLTSAVLNMSRDDYNRLNAMSVTKEEEEVLVN